MRRQVVLAPPLGYDRKNASTFYALNPMLLDHHIRRYHIAVLKTENPLLDTLSFVHKANWTVDGIRVGSNPFLPDPEKDKLNSGLT